MSTMRDYGKVAAASPHRSLDALVDVAVTMSSSQQWKDLDVRRGLDFHRARDEKSLCHGCEPHYSVAQARRYANSRAPRRHAWSGRNRPLAGTPRKEDSHAALVALPVWLRSFRKALNAAIRDITGGTFRIGDEASH